MNSQTEVDKPIFLKVGFFLFQVGSLKEASEKFCASRDAYGEGSAKTPNVTVVHEDGQEVARISYNGRVWPAGEWKPSMVPLYDNRAA